MVICCSFPGIYSDLPFPRILSTSGGWANQMKKTKVCVTLGTEWNFLVLFFQTEAI